MTIVRWEPLRGFPHLQDRFNRVFSGVYGPSSDEGLAASGAWMPPVDIFENGNHELVLKAELPEMTRDDIELTVDQGTLTIKGEKRFEGDVKEDQCHRIERHYGTFSRSFRLPETVNQTKVSADYKNGVLTIRLPLREESKPRQIPVNVAA